MTPGFRMRVPDAKGRGAAGLPRPDRDHGHPPGAPAWSGPGSTARAPPDATIPVTVDVVELLGNEIFVYLTNAGATLTARMQPDTKLQTRPADRGRRPARQAPLLRPEDRGAGGLARALAQRGPQGSGIPTALVRGNGLPVSPETVAGADAGGSFDVQLFDGVLVPL